MYNGLGKDIRTHVHFPQHKYNLISFVSFQNFHFIIKLIAVLQHALIMYKSLTNVETDKNVNVCTL